MRERCYILDRFEVVRRSYSSEESMGHEFWFVKIADTDQVYG